MDLELAKIKAFYYAKVIELGSYEDATKFVQYLQTEGLWVSPEGSEPLWVAERYRIKPDTVIHPGGEMPRPLTVKEAENEKAIYTPFIDCSNWAVVVRGYESQENKVGIAKVGLAFKTKEDAIAAGHVIYNTLKSDNSKE